jgi:predicted nucleic acid-binding protein
VTIRIYLDTSVFNRPFDDQTQPRIWLETLAFSIILQMVESETALLITSTVIDYETGRNPHRLGRIWVKKVMALSAEHQLVDPSIKQRAIILEQSGLTPLDALHLACAETAGSDYFVTCDDRLINRYQRIDRQELVVCNPTEFIRITGA